jgi:cell division protein FtsL
MNLKRVQRIIPGDIASGDECVITCFIFTLTLTASESIWCAYQRRRKLETDKKAQLLRETM